MHPFPKAVMATFRDEFLRPGDGRPLTILDFGSMSVSSGTFREIFDRPEWTYLGVDMAPGPNVQLVLKDPYQWAEIEPESVDAVVSGSTLEHVEFFWLSLMQMYRVLRPGGLVCLVAPSAGPVHQYPVDCWRFHADGMKAIAKWAHLEPLKIWTNEPGEDGEDGVWRDSVLIARKEI